jgi:hypothetical protein
VTPPGQVPADPPGWDEQDREFADARRDLLEAGRLWRAAGGYWPAGGQPSHPLEWRGVVEARERRDALARRASPADSARLLSDLRAGDPDAIEASIVWLEFDPFTWHTGHLKQKIMGALCGAAISAAQADRIRAVLLRLTARGPRQEFRDACRLSRWVDSPEFRSRLNELSKRPEPHVSYAANRLLASCETKGRRQRTG